MKFLLGTAVLISSQTGSAGACICFGCLPWPPSFPRTYGNSRIGVSRGTGAEAHFGWHPNASLKACSSTVGGYSNYGTAIDDFGQDCSVRSQSALSPLSVRFRPLHGSE